MSATVNTTRFGDAVIPHRVLLNFNLAGPTAAIAANWGSAILIADEYYEVVSVKERHTTAGTDGSAVTAMLKKAPSGTAFSAGTDMLAAGLNMKSAINTTANGTLSATALNNRVIPGDGIGVTLTGTPTALAGVHITVELKRILAY